MDTRTVFRLAVVLVLTLILAPAVLAASPPTLATFDSPPPSPPDNDMVANARAITSLAFSDAVDNALATTEPGEEYNPCGYPAQRTVWWAHHASAPARLRANTDGSSFYESALTVYQVPLPVSSFGDLSGNAIGCWSYSSTAEFNALAGYWYYFVVQDLGSGGTAGLHVWQLPPPENDNFANATVITSLPFYGGSDLTAATLEPNEPLPSCRNDNVAQTAWYTYTPSSDGSLMANTWEWYATAIAIYTGPSLDQLAEIACRSYWNSGPVLFAGGAGQTFYIQVARMWNASGWVPLTLEPTPPPQVSIGMSPWDPSAYDTVQFWSNTWDPAGLGISSTVWDLGDGTTSVDCCPSHRYAADGDYLVRVTVTTPDGRSASAEQTIRVATHDVAIVKLTTPVTARVGQTRAIEVVIKNNRYPEVVSLELYKSTVNGYQHVATTQQTIPVRQGGRTTSVKVSYTFNEEDAVAGKVTFRVTANIQGYRDALWADNEAISPPTKVTR